MSNRTAHSRPTQHRRPVAVLLTLSLLLISGCRSQTPSEQPTGKTGEPTDSTVQPPVQSPSAAQQPETMTSTRPQVPDLPADQLPQLTMIGPESGFEFERFDDISGKRRIMETNGGGVALLDYDRDGWLDAFLTNGCRLPCRSDSDQRASLLFRNQADMTFQQTAEQTGVIPQGFSTGTAVGDFNNDGFDDLYVTAAGTNSLYRNNGDGTFTDITASTGTAVPGWSTSAAFSDLNNDGHLDLYVVNYLDESLDSPRLCPNAQSPDGYQGCSPALFDGVGDVVFLGDGQGGFSNATADCGLAGFAGKGLGVVIADLDRNDLQEIYVANDGEANFLFVAAPRSALRSEAGPDNRGTPGALRYEDVALQNGVALNERGFAQASMGIAAGDYDANGTTDLFLTHFYGDTNTLYANQDGLSFVERTRGSGLGASSRQTLGFGTVFFDYNNDGWLDLFVANGHVDDRTWMPSPEPYGMPPQVYRNQADGTFLDVSRAGGSYFDREWLGRGVARGDLDHDGRVDLVVSHQLDRSVVLRNETPTEHAALVIQLAGTVSNRNGYGVQASIVVGDRELYRELVGGASFQSASALELHAGVGAAKEVTVQLRWPSGIEEQYDGIAPGRWLAIEGQGLQRASF